MSDLTLLERIEHKIYLIRRKKVMLDRGLAGLYGERTGGLNKAVTRNLNRFPDDFMFSLNKQEFQNLKFQFGTSSWRGTRKLPGAFTEQGVAMLSSVLKSKRAIHVNIQIRRTFTKLRQFLSAHEELRKKIEIMERKHDKQFRLVFEAIRELIKPPGEKKLKIGFRKGED